MIHKLSNQRSTIGSLALMAAQQTFSWATLSLISLSYRSLIVEYRHGYFHR